MLFKLKNKNNNEGRCWFAWLSKNSIHSKLVDVDNNQWSYKHTVMKWTRLPADLWNFVSSLHDGPSGYSEMWFSPPRTQIWYHTNTVEIWKFQYLGVLLWFANSLFKCIWKNLDLVILLKDICLEFLSLLWLPCTQIHFFGRLK